MLRNVKQIYKTVFQKKKLKENLKIVGKTKFTIYVGHKSFVSLSIHILKPARPTTNAALEKSWNWDFESCHNVSESKSKSPVNCL